MILLPLLGDAQAGSLPSLDPSPSYALLVAAPDTSDTAGRAASPDTLNRIVDLPTLTVTATRLPTTAHNAPAHIATIDSAAIAATGGSTVADVLEQRSGLHLRRSSAYGLASPSARGSGAAQTLVLLDGHRIANPQLGQTDLSLLPASLLQSAEVMHGPAAPLYGSDGMGGAVHLRTRSPTEPMAALSTTAGAFGERGGNALVGDRVGAWAWVATGGYMQRTGDFPYEDDARFPPETVRRDNADRTQYSAYAAVQPAASDRTRLAVFATATNRGLPGPSSLSANNERQRDRTMRVWGHHRWPVEGGTLTARAFGQYDAIRYQNPDQRTDDTGRTYVAQAEAEWEGRLAPSWLLNSSLSAQSSWAAHPSLRQHARQQQMGGVASVSWTGDRLRLYPALRVDAYRVPGSTNRVAAAPRLGANWQPWAQYDALRIKAHVGRSFRMPTLNDRYWQPGGVPSLRPEQGWSLDAGARWAQNGHRVELTAFQQWHTDRIQWRPVQGVWSPRNVQRVHTQGLEADAALHWPVTRSVGVTTGMHASYTEARDRSDPETSSYNQQLPYVPRVTAKPYATLHMGPLNVDAHARYIGPQLTSGDGSQRKSGYMASEAQVRLEQQWDPVSVYLSLRIHNALNTTYTLQNNQPVPPRHSTLTLRITL
ncbi:MAG: TonB-dependent receptor plug domain-containing protein [Bacteroidota bacterium]